MKKVRLLVLLLGIIFPLLGNAQVNPVNGVPIMGATADFITFSLGPTPTSNDCGIAENINISFRFQGVLRTLTSSNSSITVQVSGTLGNTFTLTDGSATFSCSESGFLTGLGGLGAPQACLAGAQAGQFGAGTFSSELVSSPGGCGTTGVAFEMCPLAGPNILINYEKRRLSQPSVTNNGEACGDDQITLTTSGSVNTLGSGGFRWFMSSSINSGYTELITTNTPQLRVSAGPTPSGPFNTNEVFLDGITGVRYFIVTDAGCGHPRTSQPARVEFIPRIEFDAPPSFNDPVCADDPISITFDPISFYENLGISYTITSLSVESFTAAERDALVASSDFIFADDFVEVSPGVFRIGFESQNFIFSPTPGTNQNQRVGGRDILSGTSVNTAGATFNVTNGRQYTINADLVNMDPISCPLDEIVFTVNNPPELAIAATAPSSFPGTSFELGTCETSSTTIPVTISNAVGSSDNFSFLSLVYDSDGLDGSPVDGTYQIFPTDQLPDVFSIENGSGQPLTITGTTTSFNLRTTAGGTFRFEVRDDCNTTASMRPAATHSDIAVRRATDELNIALSLSNDITAISCPGGSDGAVTFTLSGGVGGFTNVTVDGLAATAVGGRYTRGGLSFVSGGNVIRAVDAAGCVVQRTVAISQPSLYNPRASASISTVQTCTATATIEVDPNVLLPGDWSGTWTGGTVSPVNGNPQRATVSNLPEGETTFTWTASANTCSDDGFDVVRTVRVNRIVVTPANAGTDQFVRSNSTTLAANSPGTGESGQWSGSLALSFTNLASPTSNVSGLVVGTNTLTWTISESICSNDDQVAVSRSGLSLGNPTISDEICIEDGSISITAAGGLNSTGFGTNRRYRYTLIPQDIVTEDPGIVTLADLNDGNGLGVSQSIGANNAISFVDLPPEVVEMETNGTATFDNLTEGTYSIIVNNNEPGFRSLVIRSNIEISRERPLFEATSLVETNPVECENGILTVNFTGGTAPYTFTNLQRQVSGSFGNVSSADFTMAQSGNSFVISNIAQTGTYRVILTDANNCTATSASRVLTADPTPFGITGIVQTNPVSCGNGALGITYQNARGPVEVTEIEIFNTGTGVFESVNQGDLAITAISSGFNIEEIDNGGTYRVTLSDGDNGGANDLICEATSSNVVLAGLNTLINTPTSTNASGITGTGSNRDVFYCEDESNFNLSFSVTGLMNDFGFGVFSIASGGGATLDAARSNATATTSGNAATINLNFDALGSYELRVFADRDCFPDGLDAGSAAPSATFSFELRQDRPNVTATPSEVTCNGGNDGSFTVAITGGQGPFEISIGTGNFEAIPGDGIIGPFSEQTLTFRIMDGFNCIWTGYDQVVIDEPDPIVFSYNGAEAQLQSSNNFAFECNDQDTPDDNLIDLSYDVSGGTETFSRFRLIPINGTSGAVRTLTPSNTNATSTSFNFRNVPVGEYTLEAEDNTNVALGDNLCTNSITVVITEPDAMEVVRVGSIEMPTCIGGDDGSFTVTGNGGGTPDGPDRYRFEITGASDVVSNTLNGNFDETIAGDPDPMTFVNEAEFIRPEGTYTVTMTDVNGCSTTNNFTILPNDNPFEVSVFTSIREASCEEVSDGTLEITVSRGLAPYRFELIEEERDTDGNAVVEATGSDINDDTFSIPDLNGLTSYEIIVTDANGCTATSSFAESPGVLLSTVSIAEVLVEEPDCNIVNGPDNTGSFVVRAAGGRATTYSFSLTGAEGSFIASDTSEIQDENDPNRVFNLFRFTDMSPGSYTVFAMDEAGCTVAISDPIVVPEAQIIDLTTVITLSGSVIDDTRFDSRPNFVLCEGETVSLSPSATNLNSVGTYTLQTGTLDADRNFVSDGSTPTELDETVLGEGVTFPDIGPGVYLISVEDGQTCSATADVLEFITADAPVIISDNATVITSQLGVDYHVSCNGGNDGVITIVINGSSEFGPFDVTLLGDGDVIETFLGVPADTDITFDELSASDGGNAIEYTYEITNALIPGCTFEYRIADPIVLTEPEAIEIASSSDITITRTNGFEIACFGDRVDYRANFSGGLYPYQLLLDRRVSASDPFTVFDQANITNVGDDLTNLFRNLTEGEYRLTVRNTVGLTCEDVITFSIDAPPELRLSNEPTSPPTCPAGSDGLVRLTALGGNPIGTDAEYRYNITNSELAGPFNLEGENCSPFSMTEVTAEVAEFRLPAGTYDFSVTDANGCVTPLTGVVIEAPADPLRISSVVPEMPSCFGGDDGSLTVTLQGGNPLPGNEFRYILSGGNDGGVIIDTVATSPVELNNLTSVTAPFGYELSVFDADVCCLVDGLNYMDDIFIDQPAQIQLLLVADETVQPECFEGTDGSMLTVRAQGGEAPYTFSTDGENFSVSPLGDRFRLTNIEGGESYTIYVRDNRFDDTQDVCTISDNFDLPEGPRIEILEEELTDIMNVSCFGGSDGSIRPIISLTGSLLSPSLNVNATDDPDAFTYEWRNLSVSASEVIATSRDLENISAGTYQLIVSRVGISCTQPAFFTVGQPASALIISDTEEFNESCAGVGDGAVRIELSGGNSLANQRLEYSLNGGVFEDLPLDRTIRNLSADDYSLVVMNSLSCEATTTFSIGANELVVAAGITREISCFAEEDGEITVEVSTTFTEIPLPINLEYSLDGTNFQSNNVFSGLAAGTFQVTVRDVDNSLCNGISEEIVLSQPSEILITPTLVSNSNCGQSDGVATVTIENAGNNPSVVWLNEDRVIFEPDQLAQGLYTILVTAESGCQDSTTFTIPENPLMELTAIVDEGTYCGLPRGRASATVVNGNAPFTFRWQNGTDIQFGPQVENLLPGEYELTVTDATGCIATDRVDIPNQAPFEVEIVEIVNTACGEDLGSITVQGVGGFEPYSYFWPTLNVSENRVTNLESGTYQVLVTDNLGCEVDTTFTIAPEGDQITISSELTLPVCESLTGAITITEVLGGVPPYSFTWRDSELAIIPGNTNEQTGLGAGMYFVEVTDADNCRFPQPAISLISDASQEVSIAMLGMTESFCSAANGSYSISISEGLEPFTVSLLDNASTLLRQVEINERTAAFDNLAAGDYSINLTDTYGCTTEISFSISDEVFPVLSATNIQSATPEIAVGGFTANLNNSPGNTYTYQVTSADGQVFTFTNSLITGLVSGRYEVFAFNSTCTTGTILVNIPAFASLNITEEIVRPTCSEASDGSIELSVMGGVEPYEFDWVQDGLSGSTNENLREGTYQVTISDAIGASFFHEVTLTALPELNVTDTRVFEPLCFGRCDGTIAIDVVGGSGDFRVEWDNGLFGTEITGLCADTYIATIIDNLNPTCQITHTVVLGQADQIDAQLSDSQLPTCFNGSDGRLSISIAGGSGLFDVTWGDGQIGTTAIGLSAGTHSVVVFDRIGDCERTFEFDLDDQLPIELTNVLITEPSCFGGDDGSIEIVLSQVVNPLIQWSNGDQGFRTENLGAGTHSFDLVDANGCTFSSSFEVGEPTPVQVTEVASTDVSCFGGIDGQISLAVTGGTGDYSIVWELEGSTLFSLNDNFSPDGLLAGTYQYTISDGNNCGITGETVIGSPQELVFDQLTSVPVRCFGESNGALEIAVSGGTGEYTYQLNGNPVDLPIENQPAGNYTVAVTDENGCTTSAEIEINQPTALFIANFEINDVSCSGAADGTITVTPAGGNGNYSYSWSNGDTTPTIIDLVAGSYSVVVTDELGCSLSAEYVVGSPNEIVAINVQQQNPICFEGSDGTISLDAIGGTAPYQFNWSDGVEGNERSGLPAGNFQVTVTDANGCFAEFEFVLTDPLPIRINSLPTETISLCAGASIPLDGGEQWSRYEWLLNGNLISEERVLVAELPGTYQLNVFTEEGCTDTGFVSVEVNENPLSADFIFDSEIFVGDTLIVIDVSWPVPGGIVWDIPREIIQLSADNTQFFQEIIFPEPGTFTIRLTAEDGGCTDVIEKQFEVEERTGRDQEEIASETFRSRSTFIEESMIVPNPSNGQFEMTVRLNKIAPVDVVIYSFDGTPITEELKGEGRATYQFNVDLTGHVAGIYLMAIRSGDSIKVEKILIK